MGASHVVANFDLFSINLKATHSLVCPNGKDVGAEIFYRMQDVMVWRLSWVSWVTGIEDYDMFGHCALPPNIVRVRINDEYPISTLVTVAKSRPGARWNA